MVPYITIGTSRIDEEHPTYIIAEIGINHNGDVSVAHSLVEKAAEAGANAVKFQKRHLESLYDPDILEHPERYEQYFQYMIPLLKRVELSEDDMAGLRDHARSLGMDFICTPFDIKSASFLRDIEIDAFKIASADLTNIPLIEHIATFRRPMILSTGMSTWDEIDYAVSFLSDLGADFALLHCRSVYPVWPREVNLRMINQLKKYNVPVGYSGHELGITVSLVAASMGACIIEKHFTLDRHQEGPDHKVSLEPYEFKRLVRDIRIADQATGKKKRFMLRGEVINRELFAKSIVAARNISHGETITREDLVVRGPGKGLSPLYMDRLVGKRAKRTMRAGEFFTTEDLGHGSTVTQKFNFKGKWGLIARFSDFQKMMQYKPKVIEFHLAEKDFDLSFEPAHKYDVHLVVHAPEYMGEELLDLCSADEHVRRKSVQLVAKTIRLANRLSPFFRGIPKVIVHPGAMSMNEKLDSEKLRSALENSLEEIRQHTECTTVELLFENLPPYPWYFGGQWKGNYFMDAAEIADFCQEHTMNICYDLSHSALYCNAKEKDLADEIKTLLPYTSHLHLADGYGLDGEGVQFGDGDIDLDNVLPLFRGFRGTWVPEIWRGHLNQGQGFLEALAFLEKYLD